MPLSTGYASRRNGLFVAEESAAPHARWPTVYLDTTVVSYLTARLNRSIPVARRQRLTQVWWHRYRRNHVLRISERVVKEARDGNPTEANARLNALLGIVSLPFDALSERLAEKLIGGGRLPDKAKVDAEHVAIAATNSISLLMTWNCKHLANPVICRAIVRACEVEGFRCPEICTPEQLMRAYSHARPTY